MVAENVFFGIIAAVMIIGALRVVTTRTAATTIGIAMIQKKKF